MGLLEKSFEFKKEMNMRGQETVMDRIVGPAESQLSPVSSIDADLDFVGDLSNIPEAHIADFGAENSTDSDEDSFFALPEELDISNEIRIINESEYEEKTSTERKITEDPLGPSDSPDLKKMRLSHPASNKKYENDSFTEYDDDELKALEELDLLPALDALDPEEDVAVEKGNFSDYALLHEIESELIRAATKDDLFDVILFSLMGNLACSSASLISREKFNSDRWIISFSKGIQLNTDNLFFQTDRGFLSLFTKQNNIIDIDDYRDEKEFSDEYMECLSLDGRYMVPVKFNNELIAVVLLSERLDANEYSTEEAYFIATVCETAGFVLNRLLEHEKLKDEITALTSSVNETKELESLEEQFVCEGTLGGMIRIIREEFKKHGVENYAVFARSRQSDTLSLMITEENSRIGLDPSNIAFEEKSPFVKFVGKSGRVIDIEGFRQSPVVREVFTIEQIKKMSMIRIYPYLSSGRNIGFILVFNLFQYADMKTIDVRMQKISRFIFNAFYLIQDVDANCSRYTDSIEAVYKRIDRELDNASELDIPVSLVLFSIKNFKRYYNMLGEEQANILLSEMEKNIRSRLSDSDFSVRYGRSSFLIVLPGKEKKTALQLSAAIRNSILQNAKNDSDVSLLMTFLAAQYPEDGSDLFTLLDFFD